LDRLIPVGAARLVSLNFIRFAALRLHFGETAQMTKLSKLLTVAVAVFAVVFMGIAAVISAARTDWKEKATKELPETREFTKESPKSRIASQKTKIEDLDKQIKSQEAQQQAVAAAIEADVKAIADPKTGREAQLEKELADLIEQAGTLAKQIEEQSRIVQSKQDVDKRRREEVTRLKSQYDDLVAQKHGALADVKRYRDLLFQARGLLERVKRRADALKAEATKGKDNGY
jgi:chromosome segregation ATPase